jgi:hypothetical protein
MASHYVSLTRGTEGMKMSDFTTGTSSAATDLFELRILDGVTPKKAEVLKALKGFERYFENAKQVGADGFDVAG